MCTADCDVHDGGASSGTGTPSNSSSFRASPEASCLVWRGSDRGSPLRRWRRLATKLRATCVAQWLVQSNIKSLGSVPHVSGKPCRPCDFHKKGKCFDGVTCRFCHEGCGHTVVGFKGRKSVKRQHQDRQQRTGKRRNQHPHRHAHNPESAPFSGVLGSHRAAVTPGAPSWNEVAYSPSESSCASPTVCDAVQRGFGWTVSEDGSVNQVQVHPLLARMLQGAP